MSAAFFKRMSWAVVGAIAVSGTAAWGAESTRVVSSLNDENGYDFNLTIWWLHQWESSYVEREYQSAYAAQTELVRDLAYSHSRDTLNFRADFGILYDVGVHIQAPLVLADSSSLSFDRSAGNCSYPDVPGGTGRANCVDASNSTLLRDGILPTVTDPVTGAITGWGLDAPHNRPFTNTTGMPPGPANVFQSPTRRGFENLGVGITWAAFNQARDDTKPTWTLSFDALLDIFKDMGFDPANPTGNTAVGPGYHQLVFSTWVSKRFRHLDPFVGGWYMLPLPTSNSIFSALPNQPTVNPQQQAGVAAGVEVIAWENAPARQRVTIEGRAHLQEYFYGRGYSELWQPLAGRSDCDSNNTAVCRPGIDLQYMNGNNLVDAPYPGVTDIESYAAIGGEAGLNVEVGKFIRFHGLFGFTTTAPHFITGASPGIDTNGDHVIDSSDPKEANAAYREAIDLPGRRFRVEGTKIWSLFLEGSMMF